MISYNEKDVYYEYWCITQLNNETTTMFLCFIWEHEIEYGVLSENNSDTFDIRHCQIKVKVTVHVGLQNLLNRNTTARS